MLKLTNQKQNFKKLSFVQDKEFKIENQGQGYLVFLNQEEVKFANILYDELCQLFSKIKEPVTLDFAEISTINANVILRALNYVFYQMVEFKTKKNQKDQIIALNGISDAELKVYQIKFETINQARYLDDLPPNIATSIFIAQTIQKEAQGIPHLKVKVFGKKELRQMKMSLLLAVNKGSVNEPQFVILEYLPQPKKKVDAVLVGKGITMDTGGYSLKINGTQTGMKFDMCGASLVLNTVLGLAKLKSEKNLVALAPLTDNCIGYGSTFVESICHSYSGKTVEINNTDAEGRLVLADAISYAKKNYEPAEIIDYATLTGSVKNALGIRISGAFTNDLNLFKKFEQVSQETGEALWLLPIQKQNYFNVTSLLADLKNASMDRNYGVGNAAAFLETFAHPVKWLHFDIAGTAENLGWSTGVLIDTTIEYYLRR